MTNPWLGMPAVAAVTNLYTIVKDLNSKPDRQQESHDTFSTIPDHLTEYVSSEIPQERTLVRKFFTHTRFKHLQSPFGLHESVGVIMTYRIYFTLVSLDKNRLKMALDKEFNDAKVTLPKPQELRDARATVRSCESKLRPLQDEETRIKSISPTNRQDRAPVVVDRLKDLRYEIMAVRLEMAEAKEIIRNAKRYVGKQVREDEIKELSRGLFISNFSFELIDPQKFSTGLKGTGRIGISTAKSLQGGRITVNFQWDEEHLLGKGHSWAGNVFFMAGRQYNDGFAYGGQGKFYDRFLMDPNSIR